MEYGMIQTFLGQETENFNYQRAKFKFNVNESLFKRIVDDIDVQVFNFIKEITGKQKSCKGDIYNFLEYINTNPIVGKLGTTRAGSLFWLFIIARSLNPKILVESGVFKGSSLHCFRYACQNTDIFAFDLNLTNLEFQDESIHYFEKDFSQVDVSADSENDLCYFDDHINQALRIRQAFDRGFKNLIFDDAPFVGEVHNYMYPGLPTVPMILSMKDGDYVEWYHQPSKKYFKYHYNEDHAHGAKQLIEFVKPIPNLKSWTSMEVGTQYFVRLK